MNIRTFSFVFTLGIILVIAPGCASSSSQKPTTPISDTLIGIDLACVEGWTCEQKETGAVAIYHPDAMTNIVVTKTAEVRDTLDETLTAEIPARTSLLRDMELLETMVLSDTAHAALTKGTSFGTPVHNYIVVHQLSADLHITCDATIASDVLDTYLADAKQMCSSVMAMQ